GGAYIPIDPRYPEDRIDQILHDTEPNVLLSERAFQKKLGEGRQDRIICLDEIDFDRILQLALNYASAPNALAYIIYTSGSTGRPKGVPISNAQLADFIVAMNERIGMGANDRILATTTIAFDVHTLEIFLPLTVGAAVFVAPVSGIVDGR